MSRILAQILHDVVKGVCGERGFVGHIGGDDFIFIIPVGAVSEVCGEIIAVFDTLIPFQHSEQIGGLAISSARIAAGNCTVYH